MKNIINDNRGILMQLVAVLEDSSVETYNSIASFSQSSFGGHVRHVIDHYVLFLSQVHSNCINYDQRERALDVETNPTRALIEVTQILSQWDSLFEVDLQRNVDYIGESGSGDCRYPTSVGRELQFLLSHTVHHFAILAMMMRDMGKKVDGNFGVAPSTLKYLQKI